MGAVEEVEDAAGGGGEDEEDDDEESGPEEAGAAEASPAAVVVRLGTVGGAVGVVDLGFGRREGGVGGGGAVGFGGGGDAVGGGFGGEYSVSHWTKNVENVEGVGFDRWSVVVIYRGGERD